MFFQHVYYTQIINVKGFNGSKYLTTLWPINFFNTFFLRLLYSNNLCQGYYISVSSFCARIVHCHLKNNSTLFGFWELLFFLVYIWFCCFFLGVVFGMRCFWYALFLVCVVFFVWFSSVFWGRCFLKYTHEIWFLNYQREQNYNKNYNFNLNTRKSVKEKKRFSKFCLPQLHPQLPPKIRLSNKKNGCAGCASRVKEKQNGSGRGKKKADWVENILGRVGFSLGRVGKKTFWK